MALGFLNGIKGMLILSFLASLGLMFLVLACALPQYNNWWPLFMILFYVIAPIPYLIYKRRTDVAGESDSCRDLTLFLTTVLLVSAFALPIVLATSPYDSPVIKPGACGLIMAGNVGTFLTIFFFIGKMGNQDFGYSS